MRWKSLCAAVAASFALLVNETRSEQREPDDSDRQAYAAHKARLPAALTIFNTTPRITNPDVIARTIKTASPRNSECYDLRALGYRRFGNYVKNRLSYDTADCELPATSAGKFAVYGDPHDIFVYTKGPYQGKLLREVEGRWTVFDRTRPVMEDGAPLVYTKGDPYDDNRLQMDSVEGAGNGFGSLILYRNRFGDHIFFSMVEGRTTSFSIWPLNDWPNSTTYQRLCDGRFSKVEQLIPLYCAIE